MAEKIVAGMDTVKKAVQTIVAPGLADLKTEVRVNGAKQEEMGKRLEQKIDANTLRLEQKMDAGFSRMDQRFDSMAKSFDTQRELAVLKAKVAELEKRK